MTSDYHRRRVTILGLGHFGGGVAAARWLARRGGIVTVTDLANESELADSLPLLADVPIAAYHLGGHCGADFHDADLVVVNPAVRPSSPWLEMARQSGARLCTELELFMENCPARMIGVTGSNGKSTTAAITASMLRAAGHQTFLGGNIGGSLLEQLPQTAEKVPQIGPDDWVVLEISSFQLWHFGPNAKMPQIAVVTGCSPNHLDWHENYADYIAAKQRILTGQTHNDFAVLNMSDTEVALWAKLVRGQQILPPSPPAPPPKGEGSRESSLPLFGEHNRINASCAAAAALAAGCTPEQIDQGLRLFQPLPQRLEQIAVIEGRRFYNDSTATTPESTIAALKALDMPVWLMAGGKSKGFDFSPLAVEIVRRAAGAAFYGAAAEELRQQTAANNSRFTCTAVGALDEALQWCWTHSRPGEAIVLSPACASTDQFVNFFRRGERFVELVRALGS